MTLHAVALSDAAVIPETVLEVRDLSTHFETRTGTVKAVDGVSFTVHRGRTLAVVGESGSGKSVTARSVLQIVDRPGRIVAGSIVLHRQDGSAVDLAKLNPRGREIRAIRGREIAMIFQEPMSSLSPVHTIGNQIEETLRIHLGLRGAAARAKAVELLSQVEIPNAASAADRYTFEYSGGMRQRAMIAMALACNPSMLIADEPTTALDVTTQAEILALIARLQREHGMGVMFITHDMGVVAEIADEVAVMHDGRLVETGPTDRIFHAPTADYTRMLIGAAQKLERRAEIRLARPAPDPAAPPLVTIRGLTMQFGGGGPKAVDDVSLTVRAGETLGIVGESGSGKTTLGRCLLRVYQPTAGAVDYRRADGNVVDLATADRDTVQPPAARSE